MTYEEKLKCAIIAWCCLRCWDKEIRIPRKQLEELINGGTEIKVVAKPQQEEYVIKLARSCTSPSTEVDEKEFQKRCEVVLDDLDERIRDVLDNE